MQLPIKAHYATLAMLAMAERYHSQDAVPARCIALEHKIPNQFLGQILQQLRAAGLVISMRGAGGGFRLAQPPEAISVGDIVDAVCQRAANTSGEASAESRLAGVVNEVWQELEQQQHELLGKLRLDNLLHRLESTSTMFYI